VSEVQKLVLWSLQVSSLAYSRGLMLRDLALQSAATVTYAVFREEIRRLPGLCTKAAAIAWTPFILKYCCGP